MGDRTFIEDCERTRVRSERIMRNLEWKRKVAFSIICIVIFLGLIYDTGYWAFEQFWHKKAKHSNINKTLTVAFQACYSTLFGLQFLVWVAAVVVYCMLKYYLYPMKLPGNSGDVSPLRLESNPMLWRQRKREERIAKF